MTTVDVVRSSDDRIIKLAAIRRFTKRAGIRRSVTLLEGEIGPLGAYRVYTLCGAVGAGVLVWAWTGGLYLQSVIAVFGGYVVSAVGYNLIIGFSGLMSFGQAGFMAAGAYGYAMMTVRGVPPLPAFIATAVMCAILGVVVAGLVSRVADIYLALITLAFAQALASFIQVWSPANADNGIGVHLLGNNIFVLAIIAGLVATIMLDRISRSRHGRAFAMIRSNARAAAAMGVNVPRTKILSFALGAMFGGIGGIIYAAALTFVTPENFTSTLTIDVLLMVIVGGIGSVFGAAIGAGVIVELNQYLANTLALEPIVYGLILIAVLVLIPKGLTSLPAQILGIRRGTGAVRSLIRGARRLVYKATPRHPTKHRPIDL